MQQLHADTNKNEHITAINHKSETNKTQFKATAAATESPRVGTQTISLAGIR